MSLNPSDMRVQLGRYLSSLTGDSFVEASSGDKGSIYAVPLPAAQYRNNPAIAIIEQLSATDEPMSLTERIAMVIHAEGDSNSIVTRKLADMQRLMWPNHRPHIPVQAGFKPGIVGVPAEAGTHDVWRIVELRQLTHPSINPRTAEGFASASFSLEAHAVKATATV